jgi:hypothetical protein
LENGGRWHKKDFVTVAECRLENDEVGIAEHNASGEHHGRDGGVPWNAAGLGESLEEEGEGGFGRVLSLLAQTVNGTR